MSAMNGTDIKQVAVVGAGIMGHGMALVFAQSAQQVFLADTSDEILERALGQIKEELQMLQEEGLLAEERQAILDRILLTTDLAQAVREADYVAEAVSEDLDLKRLLFRELDSLSPERTILASNTSFLPIRELAGATGRPDRVLGAHHVNPPHIVPLVELVPTGATSDETIESVSRFLRACGKVPALLKRDVHGFMPRLLAVLQNEAIRCLQEGLATAEDIDKMVSCSIGFRLPTLGPLRSLDYWSLELFKAATDYLVEEYQDERYRSPALVANMVADGRLGMRAGAGFYRYDDVDVGAMREARDRKYCKQLKMMRAAGVI